MDGSILIEQRKQRVRRWRFNMDGDFFFCHPLWKDPLIVRGVRCFHINGFFSILFLCFFRLFTGNKWLAGMGPGFDFFVFMDTVFTLVFFLVRFFFVLNSLHTCCFLAFYVYAMPYFLALLLFYRHYHVLSIVFRGKKGESPRQDAEGL